MNPRSLRKTRIFTLFDINNFVIFIMNITFFILNISIMFSSSALISSFVGSDLYIDLTIYSRCTTILHIYLTIQLSKNFRSFGVIFLSFTFVRIQSTYDTSFSLIHNHFCPLYFPNSATISVSTLTNFLI